MDRSGAEATSRVPSMDIATAPVTERPLIGFVAFPLADSVTQRRPGRRDPSAARGPSRGRRPTTDLSPERAQVPIVAMSMRYGLSACGADAPKPGYVQHSAHMSW